VYTYVARTTILIYRELVVTLTIAADCVKVKYLICARTTGHLQLLRKQLKWVSKLLTLINLQVQAFMCVALQEQVAVIMVFDYEN
jgi:hypothetical protein